MYTQKALPLGGSEKIPQYSVCNYARSHRPASFDLERGLYFFLFSVPVQAWPLIARVGLAKFGLRRKI